jgi:putative FmdB family regulatory protein
MPIYEYKCRKCGKQFEVSQKMSEKALTRCPTCRGEVYRLISAPALQFKGTGWYVTDYARKGSGNGDKEEKKQAGGKEGDKKTAGGDGASSQSGEKKKPQAEPKASPRTSED